MHASLSEMAQLTLNSSFTNELLLTREAQASPKRSLAEHHCQTAPSRRRVILNHSESRHLVGENMRMFEHCNLGSQSYGQSLLVQTTFWAESLTLAQ